MKVQSMRGARALVVATILLSMLSVASEAARPSQESIDNMIPTNLATVAGRQGTLAIVLDDGGSKQITKLLNSERKHEEYVQALGVAIVRSGVFKEVTPRDDGNYRLEIVVTSVGVVYGIGYQLNLNTTWRLTDVKANRVVWTDVVGSTFNTTIHDAASGAKRVRLTQEGVFRENIRLGIAELAKLEVGAR